jgi:hypothetical protein
LEVEQMKRGLAVLAVLVGSSLSASGAYALSSPNLIKNGGAETGPVAHDDAKNVAPTGWHVTGNFTGVSYGYSDLPSTAMGAQVHGGKNFFAGGPDNAASSASQTITLSKAWLKAVAVGKTTATLSADLGGWQSQNDAITITASFRAANGSPLGKLKIGPVNGAARGAVTEYLARSTSGAVPAKTTSVTISMSSHRSDGSYDDGYADNLSLTLSH